MKIILSLSLLLNVLLVGGFAGRMIQSHRYRPIVAFGEIQPGLRESIRTERGKLAEIMRAENFDSAAFDAQLQKTTDLQCDFDRKFMVEMNKKLQQMPVAERVKIIDKMMSRGRVRK